MKQTGMKKLLTRPLLWVTAVLMVGLLIQSGPVFAASFTCTATSCTDDLTFWNVSQLNATGDHITVTFNRVTDQLTFQFVYGTQPPTIQLSPTKGIDLVGWNGPVPTTFTGWSIAVPPGTQQEDSFGLFSVVLTFNAVGGNTGSGLTAGPFGFASDVSASFGTSANAGGSNDGGHFFVAHVQFGNDCSGYVSDVKPSGSIGSTPGCAGSPVPEPASLMLLGSGLAGLGLWKRARRKGTQV